MGERGGDHSTVAAVSNGDRFPLLRQSWLGVGWGRGAGITQLLLQSPMGTGSPCLGNLGWGWGGGEGRGSLNCCCSLQWGLGLLVESVRCVCGGGGGEGEGRGPC